MSLCSSNVLSAVSILTSSDLAQNTERDVYEKKEDEE